MLDCVATLVAAKRAERVGAKLRNAREALRQMHGNAGPQPIGD
jgi:hypothetical protein